MVALFAMYYAGNRLRLRERWLGHRSLAEAFRSGMFIAIAARIHMAPERSTVVSRVRSAHGSGLARSHVSDAREPLYERAFSEVWRDRPEVDIEKSHGIHLRRFLRDAWIDHQARYHRAAAARSHRASCRLTILVFGLFSITVLAGVLHLLDVGGSSLRQLFTPHFRQLGQLPSACAISASTEFTRTAARERPIGWKS